MAATLRNVNTSSISAWTTFLRVMVPRAPTTASAAKTMKRILSAMPLSSLPR